MRHRRQRLLPPNWEVILSIFSYIRGKYYNLQKVFESFAIEIKSGYKDGLAGKQKADHWVRYLQKQKRENDTMRKEYKE